MTVFPFPLLDLAALTVGIHAGYCDYKGIPYSPYLLATPSAVSFGWNVLFGLPFGELVYNYFVPRSRENGSLLWKGIPYQNLTDEKKKELDETAEAQQFVFNAYRPQRIAGSVIKTGGTALETIIGYSVGRVAGSFW